MASDSPCLTSDYFVEISECYTIFKMMNACPDVNMFPCSFTQLWSRERWTSSHMEIAGCLEPFGWQKVS